MSIAWKSSVLCACLSLGVVQQAGAEAPPEEQQHSGEKNTSPAREELSGPSPSPERTNLSRAPSCEPFSAKWIMGSISQ